jgi:hypothetical protein
MRKALVIAAIFGGVLSPAAAQTNSPAPAASLATRPGWEAGGQFSDYRYQEPNPVIPGQPVKVRGSRIGLAGARTYTAGTWFFKGDARYSYGELQYQGSGTKDQVPDSILEVRGVFGLDLFPGGGVSLSPYAGLGFRYLYDNLRGTTSTGAAGYRRYSTYLYAPLGLTSRFSAGDQWVITPTVEYDYFIKGKQVSMLTDASLGYVDAYNTQKRGHGFRLSVMAEKNRWAFGPWWHYWNIDNSDSVSISSTQTGFEPKNWTREAGVEVRYRF